MRPAKGSLESSSLADESDTNVWCSAAAVLLDMGYWTAMLSYQVDLGKCGPGCQSMGPGH